MALQSSVCVPQTHPALKETLDAFIYDAVRIPYLYLKSRGL